MVINRNYNKQLVTASKLHGQHGHSGSNTDGVTTVLSIIHAIICYKNYKFKWQGIYNTHVIKVPLAIYLIKNKNTILLIIKPFKLVKTFKKRNKIDLQLALLYNKGGNK